jgi:polysaccharide export outer membrane protein
MITVRRIARAGVVAMTVVASVAWLGAQAPASPSAGTPAPPAAGRPPEPAPAGTITPPPDYVIGVDDVLTIDIWKDANVSGDVQVRPDGKISLKLLGEIVALGLTPAQLTTAITTAATKMYTDTPVITVGVKQINSRKVYILGEVNKQGPMPLTGRLTVLQALSIAGGPTEYAKTDRIVVLRTENGKQRTFKVNYKEIMDGKKLEQNIELRPGDTINVP